GTSLAAHTAKRRKRVYTRSRFSTIAQAGLRGARRHWMAIAIPIAALLIIVFTIAVLTDEPMPRYTETKMDQALNGYTAPLGQLDFAAPRYSLDLSVVLITQDAQPDPPVLQIARLGAGVHWRALLSGPPVGEVGLERPTVYPILPQARKEINDPTPVK